MLFAITVSLWIVFVVNAKTAYQGVRFLVEVSDKFEDFVKRHRSNLTLNGHGWSLSRFVATGLTLVVLYWVRYRTPDVTLLEAFAAHPYLVVSTFGGCLLLLGRSISRYRQSRDEQRKIREHLRKADTAQKWAPLVFGGLVYGALGSIWPGVIAALGVDLGIEVSCGVIVREKSKAAIRQLINRLAFDLALRCAVVCLALSSVHGI